jgi:preprotein translocase subunit SecF
VLGAGELQDLALVLFVGMLSGTYSSICIATPVLAGLKEREGQYKQLAKRVALRESGGRAAQRRAQAEAAKAAKAAKTQGRGATAATVAPGEPGLVTDELDNYDQEATAGAGLEDAAPDEPVPAGRAASSSVRPGARPGPRQQPRRSSAAKRRPAGKKKRR